jgi:hypothetical protein
VKKVHIESKFGTHSVTTKHHATSLSYISSGFSQPVEVIWKVGSQFDGPTYEVSCVYIAKAMYLWRVGEESITVELSNHERSKILK